MVLHFPSYHRPQSLQKTTGRMPKVTDRCLGSFIGIDQRFPLTMLNLAVLARGESEWPARCSRSCSSEDVGIVDPKRWRMKKQEVQKPLKPCGWFKHMVFTGAESLSHTHVAWIGSIPCGKLIKRVWVPRCPHLVPSVGLAPHEWGDRTSHEAHLSTLGWKALEAKLRRACVVFAARWLFIRLN